MFMKRLMIGLPILFLIASCGKTTTTSPAEENITSTTYSNSRVVLTKQMNQCSAKAFNQQNSLFNLNLFLDGKLVTEPQDFLPYLRGTRLSDGAVIGSAVYGEVSEIILTNEGMRVKTTTNPKDLIICPGTDGFERESVESAALNATFFIHKTNAKIKSVLPDLKIAPITLSIAPSVTRSVITKNWAGETVKESLYMTDNALYSPAAAMITFLPHSSTIKENGFKANFWEVPMVASHEYGHHIFQSIHTGASQPLECFGNTKTKRGTNKRLDRAVKQDDILVAYNEGFADLIAHYSLSDRERDVSEVKCLEVSRDVASPVFFNGKPKIFDKEVMRSFFSSFEDFTLGSCEDHSYQDVHVIGAIFAHSADQFLGKYTNNNDEKLVALVNWVKYLKAERKQFVLLSPKNFMKKTMSEFVRISLKKFDKSADESNCKIIKDIYPELELDECSKN